MDTSKLKKFAQAARNSLMDQVAAKLHLVLDPASAARREHPEAVKELESAIRGANRGQIIEQVAYTWFNRFTALRFMDACGYTSPRVVSPAEGQTRPELLSEAMAGNLPDGAPAAVQALLDERMPSHDPQGEGYRLLLVHACNHWHRHMPFLFEEIDDYTELLMPEDLLSQTSILARLREVMTEEACQDVEIIGWLYQFYISEKKDQVFAALKKNVKITVENIPAATQLFTPHWIVRYLVENSLGRLWLLNRPQSKLAEKMDYYIAPEEPETDFPRVSRPEEIRICDPACGSGHMLTYAFDLLCAIYEEEGYEATGIPALILTHNLHGVEIDARAGALAAFALVMKAAAKLGTRRFLRMEAQPDIVVLQEHSFKLGEFNDFLADLGYDLNVDRVAGGLKTVPLLISGIWSQITRYLKDAEGARFEDVFESAARGFKIRIANEIGMSEEASQNPFLLNQLNELRADLVAFADADENQQERKALEKAFEKKAQSPCIATRIAELGADYRRHKNDTTYRMDLDALVERAEEAARSPNVLSKLKVVEERLVEAVAFHAPLWATLRQFEWAKNFGSLIVPRLRDPAETLRIVEARDFGSDLLLNEVQERVVIVLRMAEALSPKYHVVVANPPYAGAKGLNEQLSDYIVDAFPDGKNDLMTSFVIRATALARLPTFMAFVTLDSWMFIASFEDFRGWVSRNGSVRSMLHVGWNCFPEGHVYNRGTAFVYYTKHPGLEGAYIDLSDVPATVNKRSYFGGEWERLPHRYTASQENFIAIPSQPIAYSLSRGVIKAYAKQEFVSTFFFSDGLTKTGDNERFLRFNWELSAQRRDDGDHYRTCIKGGESRKYFGNTDVSVDWKPSSRQHYKSDFVARISPEYLWDRDGITWTKVSSKGPTFRWFKPGMIAETGGPSVFLRDQVDDKIKFGTIGFLNSKVSMSILERLSPTINVQTNDVLSLPVIEEAVKRSHSTTERILFLSENDWSNNERAREFTSLPLLAPDHRAETLEVTYADLRAHWQDMTDEMRRLEEENNRIFIDAYGLADELMPEVSLDEITLTCNPAYRYGGNVSENGQEKRLLADTMAEFLHYAVGCMFGRFSLDEPGLVLANQGETLAVYLARVPDPTFPPDADNVIPMLEGDWFADDITERFRRFLLVAFGEEKFRENLAFIEAALGKDIRRWFTRDFYDYHVRRYRKRPIYWMFSSPKGSFNALIYMHRYRSDTVSVVLNEYLRELITKLQAERTRLEVLADDPAASQSQRTRALKDVASVIKQLDELTEWEREVVFPLAQAKIEIDLDDGVKANYPKFGAALKPIKGLETADE